MSKNVSNKDAQHLTIAFNLTPCCCFPSLGCCSLSHCSPGSLCYRWFPYCHFQQCTGCSGKIVFFHIHCNPSLAHIAVRDYQSSQRNASVQSLLLAGNFFYTANNSRVLTRASCKLLRILGKNTIFYEHPVCQFSIIK